MDPKWTNGNELNYLTQVLENSDEVRKNPFTDKLEKAFIDKYNVKYAIALNSGASGLHSAMVACDVQPGDEIITSPFSVLWDAAVGLIMGAKVKFADIKYGTHNLDAEKVGKLIIGLFNKNEFDICTIFYNQFKNVITQIPQEQQIIPLQIKSLENPAKESKNNYEFEPDEDEILGYLLPKNVSTQIFKALLENSASEQGSRMSAMDSATRNAGELVDKLTINYNRSRQAAITKELIEIISGAESL